MRLFVYIFKTELGDIVIELYFDRSPVTAKAFVDLIETEILAKAGFFYRSTSPENDNGMPKISILEGGLLPISIRETIPFVEHEATNLTGLSHVDGVLSLGRGGLGSASPAEFFICIGDQRELDAGGLRNKDGCGFAAFGKVISGMRVVRKIHALKINPYSTDGFGDYYQGQLLDSPIKIVKVYKVQDHG